MNNKEKWEEIIPLSPLSDLDDLPSLDTNIVPRILREYSLECARYYQTPFEMPFFCGLACLATCLQGKFQVEVKQGYNEPLNLYIIITAEPSELKSPTLKAFKKPLEEWEAMKNEKEKPIIHSLISQNKTLEKLIEGKRARACKINDIPTLKELSKEIMELEEELSKIPNYTRLFADDVTPESLGVLLEAQNGRLSIAEAEGGFFAILAGRYSKGIPNLDLILKAYNSENVRIDRKGFQPIFIKNPYLTLLFLIQPFLLMNRENGEAFKGRGLDARFLYVMPKSKIGYREYTDIPINSQIEEEYSTMIKSFLDLPCDIEKPFSLKMTKEASIFYTECMNKIEVAMREGNELENMRDWAGKKGSLARLVGILHCATYKEPQSELISKEIVENAWSMLTYLIAHAKRAYGIMFDTEEVQNINKVLSWIKINNPSKFTIRECHQANKGRIKKKEELSRVLKTLEEHFYIRKAPLPIGVSGRPSISYEVNPHFNMVK